MITRTAPDRLTISHPKLRDPGALHPLLQALDALPAVTLAQGDTTRARVLIQFDGAAVDPGRLQARVEAILRDQGMAAGKEGKETDSALADSLFLARMARKGPHRPAAVRWLATLGKQLKRALGRSRSR